ncbi:heat-shock protein [Oscillatoriales cyanobacterium USR001]|nr:heat-shock protein [Oscillatoriales cyanobacterium USR001]
MRGQTPLALTYYGLLGLHPSASNIEIRQAYRELSKRYHPDTTDLPTAIATAKFQQVNEAYATLNNPESRLAYDRKLAYSRLNIIQSPPNLNNSSNVSQNFDSAYLDPTERPLSPGEIFILLILGTTLLGCLGIAIAMSLSN